MRVASAASTPKIRESGMRNVLFALLIFVAFVRCGNAASGGIVDNGNHPLPPKDTEKPEGTKPDPDQSVDAQDAVATTVLNDYTVLVSGSWKVQKKSDATTLSRAGQVISFSNASEACDVIPEPSDKGMDIYWCSAVRTVIGVEGGILVNAAHTTRTPEIEAVLKSFEKK